MIVVTLLAMIGITALAVLGAPGIDGPSAADALCSVHPAMVAELEAALAPASFRPRRSEAPVCTEQDSADDPRCHAQSEGQRPGAPNPAPRAASPDAMPAATGIDLGAPALTAWPNAPTRRPPTRSVAPPLRPPRV